MNEDAIDAILTRVQAFIPLPDGQLTTADVQGIKYFNSSM